MARYDETIANFKAEHKFPEITGKSEKQIKYADDLIGGKKMKDLSTIAEEYRTRGFERANKAELIEELGCDEAVADEIFDEIDRQLHTISESSSGRRLINRFRERNGMAPLQEYKPKTYWNVTFCMTPEWEKVYCFRTEDEAQNFYRTNFYCKMPVKFVTSSLSDEKWAERNIAAREGEKS